MSKCIRCDAREDYMSCMCVDCLKKERINSQSNEVRISREFAMFCLECLDECSHMATQEQIDELGSAIKKAESSE